MLLRASRLSYWQLLILSYPIGAYLGWLIATSGGRRGFATLPYQSAVGYILLIAMALLYVVHSYRASGGLTLVYRAPQVYQRWLLGLTFIATLSIAIGIGAGNPMNYVVSDALYPLAGAGLYVCLRLAFNGTDMSRADLLNALIKMAQWLALLAAALNVTMNAPIPAPLTTLFIATAGVSLLVSRASWGVLVLLLPLLLTIGTLNRATLLQFAVVLLIIAATRTFRVRWLVWGLVATAVAVPIVQRVDLQGSLLQQRLTAIQELWSTGDGGTPLEQRMYEAELVQGAYAENPLRWVTGFGSGATLDMSTSQDMSVRASALLGDEDVHNIHLLPVALTYRLGIVGLLLLAGYTLITIRLLWRVARRQPRTPEWHLTLLSSMYLLLALVGGLFATNQWYANPLVFAFAALVDALTVRAQRGELTTRTPAPARAQPAAWR